MEVTHMTTLTVDLEIEETLIDKVGRDSIKEYIRNQMELYKVRMLGEEIRQNIEEAGIDLEKELKDGRSKVWKKYKEEHIKKIIK